MVKNFISYGGITTTVLGILWCLISRLTPLKFFDIIRTIVKCFRKSKKEKKQKLDQSVAYQNGKDRIIIIPNLQALPRGAKITEIDEPYDSQTKAIEAPIRHIKITEIKPQVVIKTCS